MPIPNAHVNGCGCRLLQVVGAYQECCWVYQGNKKPLWWQGLGELGNLTILSFRAFRESSLLQVLQTGNSAVAGGTVAALLCRPLPV